MVNVTEAQATVLEALTDEPRSPTDIAKQLGMSRSSVTGHLYALRQKGLAHKRLNPTRWQLPLEGKNDE